MNEAVLRSPKWLRNFFDFEINTGEDIKGKPSKKRQKQMEEERKRKEKKQREKDRKAAEKREEEKKEEFKQLWESIKVYIMKNYDDCYISVPENGTLRISKKDLSTGGKNLEFSVELTSDWNNKSVLNVEATWGNEFYAYTVSGLVNVMFMRFLMDVVYEYYRQQARHNQRNKKYNQDTGAYEDDFAGGGYYRNRSQKKKEEEPADNNLRRYNLLKDVLQGHLRKMKDIVEWEKLNRKRHPEREITENEIANVRDKINNFKKKYHFENLNYLVGFELFS